MKEKTPDEVDDGWGGLLVVDDEVAKEDADGSDDKDEAWEELASTFIDGNPDDIIPDDQLPFTRFKIGPEEIEEETPEEIRTGNG